MSTIVTVDLSRWHAGGAEADAVAVEVDEGLQRAGFILVTGHGVDPDLAAAVRAASREFFDEPDAVKQRYGVPVGGHGWIGPGAEANAYRLKCAADTILISDGLHDFAGIQGIE